MLKRSKLILILPLVVSMISCHQGPVITTDSSQVIRSVEQDTNTQTKERPIDSIQSEVHVYKKKVTCSNYSLDYTGFRLFFCDDTASAYKCTYYIPENVRNLPDSAKIKLIEELLSFEGDTSLCALRIGCYDVRRSQTCNLNPPRYSVQVEALFIINLIYFPEPFSYSTFPVLEYRETKQQEAIKGDGINLAYKVYKVWLTKIKKIGWEKAHETKLYPFDEYTNVSWL